MRLRPYLMITRNTMMTRLAYRTHYMVLLLGTAIYLIVSYFLWRAIYSGGEKIGGLSFEQAYLYVALSIALQGLLQTWTEWSMHRAVVEGDIVRFLCKPLDYRLQLFFDVLGRGVGNLIGIALPATVVTFLLSRAAMPAAANVTMFAIAVLLGFGINFCIDFIVGLSVFVTHSIWGIATAKEVTVLFLSGAVVPLALFPGPARSVLEWLPFQAIYYTPIQLLIEPALGVRAVAGILLRQTLWLLCLAGLACKLFDLAVRRVVINGG